MKNLKITLAKWIFLSFSLGTLVTVLAGLMALHPADIFTEEVKAPKPLAIKVLEPPQPIEKSEPPKETQAQANLLSSLAPDSFTNQDFGAGVSFGAGNGGGPAVGGGGGFGTDASQLVGERSQINRPPRVSIQSGLEYPSEARQRNISGFVVLKILVTENGVVQNVEIEESHPRGIFEQAAIRAVKNWKFEPAMIKGKLVAAWTSQKIKFELD